MKNSIQDLQITFPDKIGILKELKEYQMSIEQEPNIQAALSKYKSDLQESLVQMENWHHDDPVRKMYRDVFTVTQSADFPVNPEIQTDWEYRKLNKIPPGYHDAGKNDGGIGDYLIWKALLKKAAERKEDALLVTNDTKSDIWHGKLYARRELVEEYREVTDGKTIRFIQPGNFLKLFGASDASIAEVADRTESIENVNEYRYEETVHLSSDGFDDLKTWLKVNCAIQVTQFISRNDHAEGVVENSSPTRVFVYVLESPLTDFVPIVNKFQLMHSSRHQADPSSSLVIFICRSSHYQTFSDEISKWAWRHGLSVAIGAARMGRIVKISLVLHKPSL